MILTSVISSPTRGEKHIRLEPRTRSDLNSALTNRRRRLGATAVYHIQTETLMLSIITPIRLVKWKIAAFFDLQVLTGIRFHQVLAL